METSPSHQPSAFVTAVAWVFIILSGLATLVSILQNIMVYTFFPIDQVQASLAPAREHQQQQMPAGALFMLEHIRTFITSILVISASTFVASIGLLRRYNWARVLFIVLLALGIAWNIGGLFLQWSSIHSMPQPQTPTAAQAQFKVMTTLVMFFTVVTAIGMSVLFGWLIRRFISPAVREEFLGRSAPAA